MAFDSFLALKVQLVVLVSAFVMVSTVWSVSCLLVLLLTVPPVPTHTEQSYMAHVCIIYVHI